MLELAILEATKAHNGQMRKGRDIPYIIHPYTVGMMLLKEGLDIEIVASGILHDTVEDTNITLEYIEKNFNKRVASIVKGCSEPDKSLPWEDRKKHTIKYLKTAPFEIQVVSCADKLHNIKTIKEDYKNSGKKVWDNFKRGKEKQKWYYTSIVESICTDKNLNSNISLFKELKKEVEYMFKA
ncbi:MAG: bifunctional (p)ppGpp synthetase/guanosine-3',5'-bis(diphosphate) 3'-pyrophosphohydrolase [Firmicutes bacterium]|nr:bifunctional (p)ppGpp synthetase/guanosine-3',5'-bis(diphosphate) 3'-pyrophosphohydrolase [Bacillota bacterium]